MRAALRVSVVLVVLLGCRAPAPRPADGDVTTADGAHLAYSVMGNGPDTLVVVHGGPGLHHRYLVEPLAPLAAGRTLIFYDQRGRGRSSDIADSSQLSLATDVADLDAVRRHFHLARLRLIAHHWGAAIAAHYAAAHPAQVERLVLLSPFAVHPSWIYELSMLNTDTAAMRQVVAAERAVRTPEDAKRFCRRHWPVYFVPMVVDPELPAGVLADQVCDDSPDRLLHARDVNYRMQAPLGYYSWRKTVNQIIAPTLIVEGKGEPAVEGAALRWGQHLPNARLLLLRRPYAFPWLGDPAGFQRALNTFLRGSWPGGVVTPQPFVVAQTDRVRAR